MSEYNLTSRELEQMRDDLHADIEEMNETLAWVNEQLLAAYERENQRGYVPAPIEKIRNTVRDHGQVTASDVARLLGISVGQASYKLKQLYEQGTLMRTKKGNRMIYSVAKPQHRELRSKATGRPTLRVVGGQNAVAGTGKDRARRQEIRKGRRGHR